MLLKYRGKNKPSLTFSSWALCIELMACCFHNLLSEKGRGLAWREADTSFSAGWLRRWQRTGQRMAEEKEPS